jgi:hypothetical protein
MAGGGSLHIGSHDADITEFRGYLGQCHDTRAIDSVIVGNQQTHPSPPVIKWLSLFPCDGSMVLFHFVEESNHSCE